ncbi:hypothetical protein ACXR8U_08295 [Methylobacterium radiotolerans]|nr:hypothetical protein [Methylobacterium organophilum]MBN6821647.1 hypothetical protein [Methylobacterium organophilum]
MIKTIGPAGFQERTTDRPPLPLVIASVAAAIAIWVPIYMQAGRLVWFW